MNRSIRALCASLAALALCAGPALATTPPSQSAYPVQGPAGGSPSLIPGFQCMWFNSVTGWSVPCSDTQPLPVTGTVSQASASTDGSGTIASGGSAQVLFGGATPTHGFKIAIPTTATNASAFACYVSDTTAAPSATQPGSYTIFAGGQWATEPGEKPTGPVYLNCPTTGTPFSAKMW